MCTFHGPGASNTTKIPRKDPKREKEERKLWRTRGKKKERNFGLPTLRGSTLLGSTLLGSTLLGSTLRCPTLRGPTFSRFGASTLRGPHTLSSQNSTSKIGRSRNWPKSKLAEVEMAEIEKKSWPKSKLAEVDRARFWSQGRLAILLVLFRAGMIRTDSRRPVRMQEKLRNPSGRLSQCQSVSFRAE